MDNTNEQSFNAAYTQDRRDILRLVPATASHVLDVGCSTGVLGASIKAKTGATVVGVELDRAMAKVARDRLDRVFVGNIEDVDLFEELKQHKFDCIIFADVLEHLRDPWAALSRSTQLLDSDGVTIASIPNIRHFTTLGNLVFRGYWPYRSRGIHDRTHLRFFTLRNIRELFDAAGLTITALDRNFRLFERPLGINKYSLLLAFWPLREFVAFQYLVTAKRHEAQKP